MPNTSATGGYLSPTGAPTLDGDALVDFFQTWLVGITGMPGANIHPRWQPEPGNIPAANVDWAALGITNIEPDTFGVELNNPAGVGSTEYRRHEVLEIKVSFYGPNAQSFAKLLSDGMQISQNREILGLNNMGLVSSSPIRIVPEIIKEKWLQRADLDVLIKRQIVRSYAVENLLSSTTQINNAIYSETVTSG